MGAGYFGITLNWIVSPFFIDPWVYGWMAPFAAVLMAFGLGLFWAAAAALATRFPNQLLGLVALLSAAELLRGHVLTGFPWAQLGHLWLGSWAEQSAALIGATGVTVVTLLAASLPLMHRLWGSATMALLMIGTFAFGHQRLADPDPAPRVASLRLVQPNAEQHLKWDPDEARILFERQLQLTTRAPRADLTIWPETSVPYLFEYSPEVPGMITSAAGGNRVALGIQRVDGNRGWNSLRVVQGTGDVTATYDKFHLVPFGEYMPLGDLMQDWFGIGAFAAQVGNGYSAGTGPAILDLGPALGTVLPLICYEAVFPGIPLSAPARPDWMLQITNDAWFGTLTGPFQHFHQARLRAIEMGLPLVRVANTGLTGVIDAKGRLIASLPFGEVGALNIAQIPGALPPTPYARWGDVFAYALLGLLALLALLYRPRRAA